MAVQREFFTTGEISRMLGVSPRTVVNYCDAGKLACEQSPLTNYRRIKRQDLVSFMNERGLPVDLIDRGAKKRILIVDDDESMIEVIGELLELALGDLSLETATDGYEACIKAGAFPPDVIILDLVMPRADGFEVCRSIRESEQTKDAEIVVVSGYLSDENKEQLAGFGVKHMFTKPLDKDSFLAAVGKAEIAGVIGITETSKELSTRPGNSSQAASI
ncbi:MAG: response regulator [Chitinivibrionales bacterium]|nr:response regulator [Chitinivibrionales bacterium]MBD3396367.1 response regulator [Chitinivibrionales bacterium]